jgi:hypothetical protein
MTDPIVVPDLLAADALGSMAQHLVGPLAAAVQGDTITLDGSGVGTLPGPVRHPLLLVSLKQDLAATEARVTVAIGAAAAVELVFAPYSERRATLALPAPAAEVATSIKVQGSVAAIDVRFIDGMVARLLYVLGVEKTRIRGTARAIGAGRLLDVARGAALDRIGDELGVSRFRAKLAWDQTEGQMVATPEAEADALYRERLRIYRERVRPSHEAFVHAMRPSQGGELAHSGYQGDLSVLESDTELAVAIRLVSPPDDSRRLAYLDYLRNTFLLPATATELPSTRPVSARERARARDLLASLGALTTWPANAFVSRATASALERAARCANALGVAGKLTVARAQRDNDGSRYELGLGIDVPRFDATTLGKMVDRLRARTYAGDPSPATRALLDAMTAVDVDLDNDGRWFWDACGMRTVHAIPNNLMYLSSVPIHGAVLDITPAANALQLRATFNAPGDTGLDANVASSINVAQATLGAVPAWTIMPRAQTLTAIAQATVPPAAALEAFRAGHFTTPATAGDIASVLAQIATLPLATIVTLRLADPIAQRLLSNGAGSPSAPELAAALRDAGAVSALPLVVGSAVFLVVASLDLPGATTFNRRRSQFRWLAVPVEADNRVGSLDNTLAPENTYQYAGSGAASQIAAILAVTPTRPQARDLHLRVAPYTVVIDADDAQPLMGFSQYEYLMNLLDRWCPLGVTIDTTRIRAHHVDVDEDGKADLMDQRFQRTFRPFRGRRVLGARS